MARHRFDHMRTAFFYFFSVLLLLSSVVRAPETSPNSSEETQNAKPAETMPTVQQWRPHKVRGFKKSIHDCSRIIPT